MTTQREGRRFIRSDQLVLGDTVKLNGDEATIIEWPSLLVEFGQVQFRYISDLDGEIYESMVQAGGFFEAVWLWPGK